MAHEEKLPWEMIEEILSRVPPKSLACFRTVSKKWNALFEDKTFLNNHKSAFRFILTNKSKFYSVSIDPEVVVRELKLGIPDFDSETRKKLLDCDEFLLCTILSMAKEAVVWNPWLNQTKVIKCQRGLRFLGIGYDSNRRVKENGYKAIAPYWKELEPKSYWTVYDFATDVWTERKSESSGSNQGKLAWLLTTPCVSLNGTLYGIAYHDKTDPLYHLHAIDLSSERYFTFCYLPCAKNHPSDALLLGVFKGERFSLLKQCHATKKIEIWVTKNKISNDDDVVWMTFMELSIPNVPVLEPIGNNSQPSYFIDDKRLVICSCDEIGRAWIYVIGKNKLINKIQVDSVVGRWPLHCTYSPSLVPVPQGPREEAEVQV